MVNEQRFWQLADAADLVRRARDKVGELGLADEAVILGSILGRLADEAELADPEDADADA